MKHITLAASANTFKQLFQALEQSFSFTKSDSANFGPFSANYSVKVHLQGGSITLNNDNTVEISNVEIVWDTLKVGVCFNLPGFCVGGWCIVPDPFDGCWVSLPKLCIGGPICIEPDLSGLVSEISDIKAGLRTNYYIDPARTPGQSDLDAEFAGHSNQWQLFLNPTLVDVLPIDIPATIDNILENLLKNAIDNLLWFLPGWAQDLLWSLIGPVLDLFKSLLGIAGDLTDWLSNLLGNVFGLVPLIETAVADYFANQYPLYHFEDPYPILQSSDGLIPVKIPIRDLTVLVDSSEMVLSANVGA
ncbi:MAG TPA: hypothetical protein VMF91_01615 [Bryobacteraceae bacterium]|nr:hypothetical protein [Bryobacteraceae bacterium]